MAERQAPLLRQMGLGLGIVSVLSCLLVGGSLLTIRESMRSASLPTATLLPPSLVVPTPKPSPTAVTPLASPVLTPSPTAGEPTTPFATPTATQTPTATRRPTSPCRPPVGWQLYTVRRGDTLTLLAWRYGTTVAAIVQANCLSGTAIIQGQRIYLPPRPVLPTATPTRCIPHPPTGWVLYTVQPGDTLYSLAMRYHTTLVKIKEVNCLRSYDVYTGQRIYLPSPPPTSTPTWTAVPIPSPTFTPTLTPLPSPTGTETPILTSTPTPTATSETQTPTPTPSTPMPTSSPTSTPSPVPTTTASPSPTVTPTPTVAEASPTSTLSPPTPTSTATPTASPTTAVTPTSTFTPTFTPTPTPGE